MSATIAWRRARAIALAGLSSAFMSCYENEGGGSITALVDVLGRVAIKACTCEAQDPDNPSDDDDCGETMERIECVEPILHEHAALLTDWAECALQGYEELEACFDRIGCDQDRLGECFQQADLERRCGDPPAEIDEEAGKRCLRDVECSTGGVVRGNHCNGIAECPDASDEDFCPSEVEITCGSGERISVTFQCDGLEDCEDGSDEHETQCASRE